MYTKALPSMFGGYRKSKTDKILEDFTKSNFTNN